LLSPSSCFATAAVAAAAAADVLSTNNICPLLKQLNPSDRIQNLRNLDISAQMQVFISRINDYRESHSTQLNEQHNDILDNAIHFIQRNKPTSSLLEEDVRDPFQFEEFKRLLPPFLRVLTFILDVNHFNHSSVDQSHHEGSSNSPSELLIIVV
jgi:hypothetical protein